MKPLLRAAGLALLAVFAPGRADSAPCIAGTLADYIGLGSAGCSVGDASFSAFASLAIPAGATPIAPELVQILPFEAGPDEPALRFLLDQDAAAGEFLDVSIGYVVSAASLARAAVSIEGSSVVDDGAVTAIEDLCLGGVFGAGGPFGCTGMADALIAFDVGLDSELLALLAFDPVVAIGVVTDVGVDGGLSGSAALASATNRFLIPESATAARRTIARRRSPRSTTRSTSPTCSRSAATNRARPTRSP